jgi:hypothetical protein
MRRTQYAIFVLTSALLPTAVCQPSAMSELFRLQATIQLPDVHGRIDYLSVDLTAKRLFVAALGNNSVEVIDLNRKARVHTISGLAEPQGITFVPSVNRVFIANRKDGSVRSFDAGSWALLKSIPFGENADNLRIDPGNGHVWVGYGAGALAEFDIDGKRVGEIKLDAHPESFQLEKKGSRVFVNLPNSQKIGVADRGRRSLLAPWNTGGALSNYPMALDEKNRRLFVVTRAPARFLVSLLSAIPMMFFMTNAGAASMLLEARAAFRCSSSGTLTTTLSWAVSERCQVREPGSFLHNWTNYMLLFASTNRSRPRFAYTPLCREVRGPFPQGC